MLFVRTKIFGIRLVPECWYSMLRSYERRPKTFGRNQEYSAFLPNSETIREKFRIKLLAGCRLEIKTGLDS